MARAMTSGSNNALGYWLLSILLSAAGLYVAVEGIGMQWPSGGWVNWTVFVYYAVASALWCFACRTKNSCKM